MKRLKILANIPKYDYGKPELGESFEYNTFFRFFEDQGHQVTLFDYTTWFTQGGQELVEKKLQSVLGNNHFDLLFTVPLTNQFSERVLKMLQRKNSGALSLAWMCDDKWRWESFSQYIAPQFDFAVTTDPGALSKYESIGYNGAILSQWGFHPSLFKKKKEKFSYDVSFIGGSSAWRQFVIEKLREMHISVACFGAGWENGRIGAEQMVNIYNQSKIVLNISNSAQAYLPFLSWVKPFHKEKTWKETVAHSFPGLVEYFSTPKRKEDIKARFFEVTGTGAFLLSYSVEHLEKYLKNNQDIVTYDSIGDLQKKISYYLEHDDERMKIAQHGYQTSQKKHTYQKRFTDIFKEIGL